MFDMKYILPVFIVFISASVFAGDTCSPKYSLLNELPLDVKFYPYDMANHKLMTQLTAPKEYSNMELLSLNLVWIPKDSISIERFQYEKGVPIVFWELPEKKGSMFAALTIPTAEAGNMAIDIVYKKHICDRYVYRLAIKHNQALKAQPSAAGDAASGAP